MSAESSVDPFAPGGRAKTYVDVQALLAQASQTSLSIICTEELTLSTLGLLRGQCHWR